MIFFIFFFFIQGLLTLCICQQPHLPSLSSFRLYRIETPNRLSTNLCVVHFRRWTVCLELKPSMSVQRGKCDPGTNEPWNGNSWKQWNENRKNGEPLKPLILFFLKKLNTPRHWQVSSRSTKSCEGIQVAGNSVVMSCILQNRTQVFWLLVVFVTMSSPDVSKEVASVAASEPPRPRAASVQATLQKDIAFKALMLRRLEQFSSQIGKTYRGPASGEREKERENYWFKWLMWLTIG